MPPSSSSCHPEKNHIPENHPLTDVGMPYFRDELELGWFDRIIFWENEMAFEETPLVRGVRGPDDHDFPFENVTLVDHASAETFHGILVEFLQLLT